jgi:hypothetical protein
MTLEEKDNVIFTACSNVIPDINYYLVEKYTDVNLDDYTVSTFQTQIQNDITTLQTDSSIIKAWRDSKNT